MALGIRVVLAFCFSLSTLFLKPTICLDPGHGTKNARHGCADEAKVVLAVAFQLKEELKQNGFEVVLTHNRLGQDLKAKNPDQDNQKRAQIANRAKALLFLRIHTDSPSGLSAIYYPQTHPNRPLAQKSQKAAYLIWRQIKTVLPKTLPQGGVLPESRTKIGAQNGGLLVGSKYSRVPVVTIELVPMSKIGRGWIFQKKNQMLLAQKITQGICDYLDAQH